MTFSASFIHSKQCATNAYLASNVVFGLAQTLTAEIKLKGEKQNSVFGCNFAYGTSFQGVILFSALLEQLLVFTFGI